ncbi:MAG TPA: phytanoyl-CoA dioxygenase family protein [Iamia sp.]
MSSVTFRARTVLSAIKGNLAAWRFWRQQPDNDFTRNGYEIIPGVLDAATCDRLIDLGESLLDDHSYRIDGDCYLSVRAERGIVGDSQVRAIMNINLVDDGVAELMASRTVQSLYEDRLRVGVEVRGFSLQVDGVDTKTKRDFHVDGLYPPVFKAFIYLTDVTEDGEGPYTIIPGSHRHYARKLANDVRNALRHGDRRRDMGSFIPRDRASKVLAPRGTMILSTQDSIHKGWQDHWKSPRFALIAHATTAAQFARDGGGPLTTGLDRLRR